MYSTIDTPLEIDARPIIDKDLYGNNENTTTTSTTAEELAVQ